MIHDGNLVFHVMEGWKLESKLTFYKLTVFFFFFLNR
jgi:hypothetical protein